MLYGSCLCGGVAYRAEGPVRDASHCYCTMCQKQHGAAAGSYANLASAGLVIERGGELVAEFASSDHGRRSFCKVCGSTLFWRSTQPRSASPSRWARWSRRTTARSNANCLPRPSRPGCRCASPRQ